MRPSFSFRHAPAVVSLVLLLSCGGGAFGAGATVRTRQSIETSCPEDQIFVAELPAAPGDMIRSRYRANGCGTRMTYACAPRTAGSEEWDCQPEAEQDPGTIFGTTEGGDSTGTSTMQDGGVADGGPPLGARVDGGVPTPVAGGDAGAATDPSTAVRAAIDANAVDILGCTGRSSIGVHASWDASGVVTFGLPGDLAGRPEEGCVRTAIGPLHVTGAPGELMDLVRH